MQKDSPAFAGFFLYDVEYGMGGDATLGGMARYVAVAPRDESTSVRNLDFGL